MNKFSAFLRSRGRSFRHAANGLGFVLRTQKNAWIHFLVTTCVVTMAVWLNLKPIEWAILLLTIGAVWMAEIINTALEAVVDLASPARHPLAKVGKDVGAAAVLIAALSAVAIGVLILGPPLWQKISRLFIGGQ